MAITVVPGKRGVANIRRAVKDFASRTNGVVPKLITSDAYKPYRAVLLEVYGEKKPVKRRHRRGRSPKPRRVPPPGMVYAVVHKVRRKGRVIRVNVRVVFGTEEQLRVALQSSSVSEHVNIAYVERYNATDRHLNSRKARKVYSFSKHPLLHEAATYFTQGIYNFCRHNRGLTIKTRAGSCSRLIHRTPAMASGITDHIWSVEQFVCYQACPPVTI
ncbi:MAG: hypothetical protein ABIF82_00790 [Planctomycetota bacterium]